jgi:hypothetical protein
LFIKKEKNSVFLEYYYKKIIYNQTFILIIQGRLLTSSYNPNTIFLSYAYPSIPLPIKKEKKMGREWGFKNPLIDNFLYSLL